MKPLTPWREIIVDERGHAVRLDAYLALVLKGVSRRRAQGFIRDGEITVNGRRARKGDPLRAGDAVAVWSQPDFGAWLPLPDPAIALAVIREEPSFLAIDKPSGIPSVPLDPREIGTLAGGIAARYPECAMLGRSPGDGGLLQRLDRGTSGVVLAARTAEAFDRLFAAQRRGEIEKTYTALVAPGALPLPERIDLPLAAAGRGRAAVAGAADGSPAVTLIRSAETIGAFALVEAVIHRGVRHQIRAHLADAGAPIAGDAKYGGPAIAGLDRLFLHACRLRAPHPIDGSAVSVESPLPPELARVLEGLG
ncbi:MAG: RluA family pseudouridine synthase [Proteobacteria bacterium]|jgi:23S rRNA pseudouridine1911/1915/1917 synthase|nr:RluA family pseudouridine synthase [Pseudomonadota bacterium]